MTYVSEYEPLPRSANVDDTLTPRNRQHEALEGSRPASRHAAVIITFTTSPTPKAPAEGDSITDVIDGTSRTTTIAGPADVQPTATLLYCAFVDGLWAWLLV